MTSKTKFDEIIETYRTASKEATEKCSSESEKLRILIVDATDAFSKLALTEKFRISLMDMRILEMHRLLVHVLYLSLSGLYRNAFDNIRYILESAVQSLYIDSRHSNSSLRTRIEIMKEVEDKREYRATNLIDKLEIDHKDTLQKEYKRLSQTIHPSHRSIIDSLDFTERDVHEFVAPVSCEEISDVFESTKVVFDMVLFLYISCASEARKEQLQKDHDLIKYCRKYSLILLSKILKG
jgi:hypothetical protein